MANKWQINSLLLLLFLISRVRETEKFRDLPKVTGGVASASKVKMEDKMVHWVQTSFRLSNKDHMQLD